MKRLLLNVTPNFPYPRSPLSGIFLARQLLQLKRMGWDSVTVHPQALLSRQSLGTPKSEDRLSGPVFRPTYLWAGWKLPRLLPFDESWAFEQALRRCVRRSVLPFEKPSIVVGNWLYPAGPGCVRLGESLDVPVLLVARGGDVRRLATMDPGKRKALVDVLARSDMILTNGRGLLEELRRIAPDLSARAMSVDFGVDTELFHPATPALRIAQRERWGLDPSGRTVLFAGRWEAEKGSHDILAVMEKVLPASRGWDVVIAGPVVDREAAAELSKRYAARFVGLVSQEELRDLYHASDVFLLLSHQEGQPNVVKEAMSSGLAVLAYDVGGVPEIIEDGVDGIVVERLSIDKASEALRRVLGDRDFAERLGAAARRKIETTYGHTRRMAWFADLLGDLVDRKARVSA